MENDYSILIGGKAGQGSKKAALVIAKLFKKIGYNTFVYNDYQSLVRGGHNFSQIRASKKKTLTHAEGVDFLLALDQNTVDKHRDKLNEDGLIIYDSDNIEVERENAVAISFNEIAEKLEGSLMGNTAIASVFFKLLDVGYELAREIIEEEFENKVEDNLKTAKLSFEQVDSLFEVQRFEEDESLLLTGNETLSLGALRAGLDFYIAYPMTPATGILNYLAENKEEFGIGVAQLENEVGVINAAVGAAYAGARTMIGTSGGGFALMTEGLSLAAQSEIPLLIVESQRTGPASGVPTYTEQADLSFVLSAGHGDITKFVAAPGDAEEAFLWSGKLLNLSWKYQTPSVLLIDKEISESSFDFDPEMLEKIEKEKPKLWNGEEDYNRYKDEGDGVSPLAFPGQKAVV